MRRSLTLLALTLSLSTTAHAARPKLGVLLVFDQMPASLLDRYSDFFDGGDFGGIDGARYDAFYEYAGTETAPGHATLATGALPALHGIATNSWFHEGKKLYVVDDPAYPVLADQGGRAAYGRSPRMLLTGTLGDAMKLESGGEARVVTVSHKDRAAILTGGKSADLAVWYDPAQGRYTTSTAYADTMPAWLDELGAALPAAAMRDATWSPLPLPSSLAARAPKDERSGEGALAGFDATFPHDLKDIPADKQKNGYRLVPQNINDLFTLALRAVDEYALGQDAVPDLLVVSVSTTDVVGHNYGVGSLEQLDTLRRSDREVRAFLSALSARVGKQNLVVALSSDHGAPDVPAALDEAGYVAPRLAYADVSDAAEEAIAAALASTKADKRKRVRGFFPPQLFIDEGDLDPATQASVRRAVKLRLERIEGVARVYDMTTTTDDDSWSSFMRNSAPPDRSASLFVRTAPRVVMLEEKGQNGTDHGTPYVYDRRVPFLLSGPGVRRGRFGPADTRDVAATLAYLLGVAPPDSSQGHVVDAALPR